MRVLLLLSGGLDSVTLLHFLRDAHDVSALSIFYGQRHAREVQAARYFTKKLGVPHEIVDLPVGLFAESALTGAVAVPHGHYAEESMRATVVPNRNMVFLSIAAARAIAGGFDAVAYAAHAGDSAVYPDCRPEFVKAMREALRLCHYGELALLTPFLGTDKRGIAGWARHYGVEIDKTWSCYEGGNEPCGKCGPCVARAEVGA